MQYDHVKKAIFRLRPNRFIAQCELEGKQVEAHVRNTGRCRELLIPGCTVYLLEDFRPGRKTQYTLISVEKSGRMVNIDSLAPNKIFREAMMEGDIQLPGFEVPCTVLKPETRFGDSRFDFYMENSSQKAFVEVKGVTLEDDGVVLFPDAPTERGVKHIRELCRAAEEGYLAYLIFVVQMKNVRYFTPNRQTHSAFGEALEAARKSGVTLLAFDCHVTANEIWLNEPVEIVLTVQ
ncbi:DNA/RNA nuclease SfsA [Dehalobacter sp. DCM]|uniref:DNA/RNA nuclease SfsA n=1 Tax=Dehalobacter sp. DCM TaxID=2907827 RepID=UPI003081F528|nr:DNA/RNA nuclease SfsA [Dehalobacter sp. DCM]